jgi:hypothetical protein
MGKKLAFTICSINYLGQAIALKESFLKHNPNYEFKIGLCDRLDKANVEINGIDIVEVHTIGIEPFQEMYDRYDITELNTAIKPFFFDYFFEKENFDIVLYIDPDILVFKAFDIVEQNLAKSDILLTPHFYTPIFDDKTLTEQQMFVNGIYNLGFLGLKKSINARKMLDWWMKKLEKECYMDIQNGMFVDQLYCNMVPLYFDGVLIEKYPGLNIAYWNLHERQVTQQNGEYFVNGVPLVFFHFSGINIEDKNNISKWQNRFDLENRPDLLPIFNLYRAKLIETRNTYFKTFPCFYIKPKPSPIKVSLIKKLLTSVSFRIYHFFNSLPI